MPHIPPISPQCISGLLTDCWRHVPFPCLGQPAHRAAFQVSAVLGRRLVRPYRLHRARAAVPLRLRRRLVAPVDAHRLLHRRLLHRRYLHQPAHHVPRPRWAARHEHAPDFSQVHTHPRYTTTLHYTMYMCMHMYMCRAAQLARPLAVPLAEPHAAKRLLASRLLTATYRGAQVCA